jgi:hypothetical protein
MHLNSIVSLSLRKHLPFSTNATAVLECGIVDIEEALKKKGIRVCLQ